MTVLTVPGHWRAVEELTAQLRERWRFGSPGTMTPVLDRASGQRFGTVSMSRPPPELRDAFETASAFTLEPAFYESIESCTYLFTIAMPGGSLDYAARSMVIAREVLDCGGLGVLVETAGIAHTAERWRDVTREGLEDPASLVAGYVITLGQGDALRSCGMHNLGLPDGRIQPRGPESHSDLVAFLAHSTARPLEDGQEFVPDLLAASRYRLSRGRDTRYDLGDPFHNPFGVWQLAPAAQGSG